MRTPFVAANWKMHKTVSESVDYARTLRGHLQQTDGVDVALAPPFTALNALRNALDDAPIHVAGQDLYWEKQGAFTGQVSAAMLTDAGASHVIIGHSERRHIFGETDDQVAKKVAAAVDANLTPIVCVGETLEQRDGDKTVDVLDRQITAAFAELSAGDAHSAIVAYEPVWAIGTGRNATPEQAQVAHVHLRARIAAIFGSDLAAACRVIYGGSVKPSNVAALSSQPDVDGTLVGGAGLDPDSFAEIVRQSQTV